ncbi:MAG: MYXO-CTERM sorting domain-containing protein [Phycisphaerales bacterium]
MNINYVAISAAALVCASASASSLTILGDASSSNGNTGSAFSATLDYVFSSGNNGVLTISMENTTSSSIGGFLTGFVFNIDSVDSNATAILNSASDADFLDTGIESASPYGMFDAGAALNANWTGGGSPSAGMAVSATESFVFSITANDASLLSSSSFFGGDGSGFAVRFRGLNNDGSDKVLATIPAPGTASLALLGLAAATRRRR